MGFHRFNLHRPTFSASSAVIASVCLRASLLAAAVDSASAPNAAICARAAGYKGQIGDA
jgi:hypothetical protein